MERMDPKVKARLLEALQAEVARMERKPNPTAWDCLVLRYFKRAVRVAATLAALQTLFEPLDEVEVREPPTRAEVKQRRRLEREIQRRNHGGVNRSR